MTRERLRAILPFAVLGVALVLTALFTTRPPDPGLPLDPRSPGPLGLKGLADVLRELGAEVRIGQPEQDGGTALLLSDDLDPAAREELLGWVAEGGTLVVADPFSELTPELAGAAALGFTTPSIRPGDCGLAALEGVGRVTVPSGSVYEVPPGSVGCYPRNEGSWLVAREEGEGVVVAVGGAGTFTNAELGQEDNAVLAASLLLPDGTGTVTFLEPPPVGSGDAGLLDLVPPGVRLAILQLVVAFCLVALWRAHRLGRPVVEQAPVEVPGSELVVAVGNLLQASGSSDHAAQMLRADARRVLAERLGLPPDVPPQALADAAAARTGARAEDVLAVVDGFGPVDEARLVRLAQSVEDVRRATLAVPRPEGARSVH